MTPPRLAAFLRELPKHNPRLVVQYEPPESFFGGQVRSFWHWRATWPPEGYVSVWEDGSLLVAQSDLKPLYSFVTSNPTRKRRWEGLDWTRLKAAVEQAGLVWPEGG